MYKSKNILGGKVSQNNNNCFCVWRADPKMLDGNLVLKITANINRKVQSCSKMIEILRILSEMTSHHKQF